MKTTDMVNLTLVTHTNHVFVGNMPLKQANHYVQDWYAMREAVREKKDQTYPPGAKFGWEGAQDRLAKGTVAFNMKFEDEAGSFALAAIGWEHVVGMYITPRGISAQDRMAKAVEDQVNLLKVGDVLKKTIRNDH